MAELEAAGHAPLADAHAWELQAAAVIPGVRQEDVVYEPDVDRLTVHVFRPWRTSDPAFPDTYVGTPDDVIFRASFPVREDQMHG